ncbi:hypothetical protein KUL42_42220 [Alteromonas sp. KUL42]|uniref:type II secretion system protein n=1 Tax=Alteromonas sp. KUL42 TaxID=2480797 RepID=UPI001035A3B0|nr:type II secretion system protein [Alteromonas sp. KUL42]TAP31365.1 type II secretion system protein [Alteromonas sp. KUL42]GEA09461.1 hypothetical protein KUL42_42220 [Alteromonas sp. KUL42]
MHTKRRNSGFTLIESLVALVILSTAFAFVWEWFGTAVITSEKIESAVELPLIYEQAHDQLELMDFEINREGSFKVGRYTVNWEAKELRSNLSEAHRKSPAWIVALFDVAMEFKIEDRLITSVDTKLVKQWRDDGYSIGTLQ